MKRDDAAGALVASTQREGEGVERLLGGLVTKTDEDAPRRERSIGNGDVDIEPPLELRDGFAQRDVFEHERPAGPAGVGRYVGPGDDDGLVRCGQPAELSRLEHDAVARRFLIAPERDFAFDDSDVDARHLGIGAYGKASSEVVGDATVGMDAEVPPRIVRDLEVGLALEVDVTRTTLDGARVAKPTSGIQNDAGCNSGD